MNILWVMLGGALGAGSRFGFSFIALPGILATTWLVNILGSIILGILMALLTASGDVRPWWYYFLVTGFCGGFTTYSSFNQEVLDLLQSGHFLSALIHIVLTVGLILFLSGLAFIGTQGLIR